MNYGVQGEETKASGDTAESTNSTDQENYYKYIQSYYEAGQERVMGKKKKEELKEDTHDEMVEKLEQLESSIQQGEGPTGHCNGRHSFSIIPLNDIPQQAQAVVQIKRGNRDNLGIIIHIFSIRKNSMISNFPATSCTITKPLEYGASQKFHTDCLPKAVLSRFYSLCLTVLHSGRPKLYGVLAFLSAVRLRREIRLTIPNFTRNHKFWFF